MDVVCSYINIFLHKPDSNASKVLKYLRFLVQINHMDDIDEIDRTIIDAIKNDARLSTRQIAKKTGIPAATVNRRLQKLVKDKVIKKFAAVLDYEKLGKKTVAYLLIRSKPGADYNDVLNEAEKHEVVEDMAACAGQFDIILKVRVKDNDELSEFIFNYVRDFPSVAQTETLIALPIKRKKPK